MDEMSIPESAAITELDFESNLILGLIGGVGAMLISAVLWGVISYMVDFQIGWMAIGVGLFVGFAIQKLGKGKSLSYGISGGALALVGCLMGNFFFYSGLLAREWEVPVFNVIFALALQPNLIVEIFTLAFEVTDVLFYVIAAYIGFRTAMGTMSKR